MACVVCLCVCGVCVMCVSVVCVIYCMCGLFVCVVCVCVCVCVWCVCGVHGLCVCVCETSVCGVCGVSVGCVCGGLVQGHGNTRARGGGEGEACRQGTRGERAGRSEQLSHPIISNVSDIFNSKKHLEAFKIYTSMGMINYETPFQRKGA